MAVNDVDVNITEKQFYSSPLTILSSVYNEYSALFDPGANVCLINDRYLFESFKIVSRKLQVKGVGSESILCEGMGTLSGPLAGVPAYYCPSLKVSILSEHVLLPYTDIDRFRGPPPWYRLINKINQKQLRCNKSIENLYVADLSEEAITNSINMKFFANATMFEELQTKGFSSDEVEKMFRVNEAHIRLGYQSMYKLALSTHYNTIAGIPDFGKFAEKDIRNYASAMHKLYCKGCNASIQSEPALKLDSITPEGISEAPGDAFFVTADKKILGKSVKLNYMLFVDHRTQMVLNFKLTEEGSGPEMQKIFDLLIAEYKKNGHELKKIRLDNWGSIIENSPAHQYVNSKGIDVKFATPGRHVRKAETFIGLLKSHLKKLVFGLRPEIILPIKLCDWAIKSTVLAMNLSPSQANAYRCPLALFTNRIVSWNMIRHRFLEVVWIKHEAKESDKTLTPSATLALVLCLREGSESGAYYVYDLRTGKVKVRHQMVRAVLDDSMRVKINKVINELDGEITTMDFNEPSEQLYRKIEDDIVKWEAELADENRVKKSDCGSNTQVEGQAASDGEEAVDVSSQASSRRSGEVSSQSPGGPGATGVDPLPGPTSNGRSGEVSSQGPGGPGSTGVDPLASRLVDIVGINDGMDVQEADAPSERNSRVDGRHKYSTRFQTSLQNRSRLDDEIGIDNEETEVQVANWLTDIAKINDGGIDVQEAVASGATEVASQLVDTVGINDGMDVQEADAPSSLERNSRADGRHKYSTRFQTSLQNRSRLDDEIGIDNEEYMMIEDSVFANELTANNNSNNNNSGNNSNNNSKDNTEAMQLDDSSVASEDTLNSTNNDSNNNDSGNNSNNNREDNNDLRTTTYVHIKGATNLGWQQKKRNTHVRTRDLSNNSIAIASAAYYRQTMISNKRPQGGPSGHKEVKWDDYRQSIINNRKKPQANSSGYNETAWDVLVGDTESETPGADIAGNKEIVLDPVTPVWESSKLVDNISEIVDVFSSLVRSTLEFGVMATRRAVVTEVMQMITKGVFGLLTPGEWAQMNAKKFRQLLPSTLVLKGKYSSDHEFQKVKARLVILGNLQKQRFEDMFNKSSTESPTVSMMGLFSVLVLAAKKGLKIASFDVAGAFLHADLDEGEEVFMKLSRQIAEILVESDPVMYTQYLQKDGSMVVSLKKCLYGLKKSPRKWFDLISSVIKEKMFYSQSEIDTCIFYKKIDDREVFVSLYVDDMLVAGSDEDIKLFQQGLIENFKDITSHIADDIDFLGMKVSRNPITGDITVKQQGYIESIVEEEEFREGKMEPTPHYYNFTTDRSKDSSGESVKGEYFHRKTMQLMYLAVRTRPDILFDVVVLSARCDNPSNDDVKSLDRILRFIYRTRSDGMIFRANGKIKLNASVDASFNCYETGRGHSGYCLFPDLQGSAAILYKSLKQKQISGSSTEAELISLKEAVQNIVWCAKLVEELDNELDIFPVVIYQDNASAIRLVTQEVVNRQGRSKFINRSLFQVKDNVDKGEIIIIHENTAELVADFFTKALHGSRYHKFRARIMGQDGDTFEVNLGDSVYEAALFLDVLERSQGLDCVFWLDLEE